MTSVTEGRGDGTKRIGANASRKLPYVMPLLGPSGCTVACGKEQIECPVVGRRENDGGGEG